MIVSVISYGYMLGSIAASLTSTASTYSAFKEKVSAIKVYLKVNTFISNKVINNCSCVGQQSGVINDSKSYKVAIYCIWI